MLVFLWICEDDCGLGGGLRVVNVGEERLSHGFRCGVVAAFVLLVLIPLYEDAPGLISFL